MSRPETILLASILALASLLRLLPLGADLPYFSSMDEADYIETALRIGAGAFRLTSFMHGTLYQLVLFAEYAGYFLFGRVFGLFGSSSEFYVAYLKDPSPFILLARITAAAAGVGIVALSYAISARIYNRRVGVVASILTGFSLLLLQTSFLALADMPAICLLMLGTYFIVRSVESPGERRLLLIGAALIGLAAACKYHAGFGIVTLYAGVVIKSRAAAHPAKALVSFAVLGSVGALVGFCVAAPQIFLDPFRFYDDVFLRLSGAYMGETSGVRPWLFVFTHHLRNGLGIPLEVASLAGLAFALYKHSPRDMLLAIFPVCFYLLFMKSVGYAYHWLPAVIFLLMLAARFLDALAERMRGRPSLALSVALATVVVLPTLLDSIKFVQLMRNPDTKILAKSWVEEHIPSGATVMAEGYVFTAAVYGPPIIEGRSTVERDLAYIHSSSRGSGRTAKERLAHYDQLYDDKRAYNVLKVRGLNPPEIDQARPQFLIMTSYNDDPAGAELLKNYTAPDFREKRAEARRHVERHYRVLGVVQPTAAVTAFFPHLMVEDFRVIRARKLLAGEGSRGPTITIWERRSET